MGFSAIGAPWLHKDFKHIMQAPFRDVGFGIWGLGLRAWGYIEIILRNTYIYTPVNWVAAKGLKSIYHNWCMW